ncbi:cysteine--tRNA ligase [Pseudooceanicola sp. 200-1SW]|uniref:cysteine--tRNA ligase n=1 Tax=Pseudooceanicola sp. 200-1SW TaxID=3425949 RepID=UPI003D7FBC79
MVEIKLHNGRTRRKELFVPIDATDVRVYVCGPTVYDRAHLGNARPVVVFDTLFRLLRHVYGPEQVTYVRNFTDVDDKINAKAEATGRKIRDITDETIAWYHADMAALGTLRPTHEPRATEYIGQMIAMIEMLIAKGHAYAAEGHVLFSVDSYKEYGALSGRSVEDMIAGARVEVAPYKRDPMDFVLWKPSDEGTPGWASPWGRGRPGWHIECSAMSYELLGESFDIHGGGIDLQFPHHENEIAQSCCAHPKGEFARYWLHNEMLQVEGKKMSKSLGNFFTVRDLLDQGVPGEVIRMVFLGTHYGKPMDWTEKKRGEAEATLRKWRGLVTGVEAGEVSEAVVAALADDLNTAGALAELHKLAEQIRRADGDLSGIPPEFLGGVRGADLGTIQSGLKRMFLASAQFLGLLTEELGGWAEAPQADLSAYAEALAATREAAMASKDFSQVDAMKQALIAAGVEVRMSKAGVELLPGADFDAAKLEGLL